MPNYKVVYMFNAQRQGWTETWYLPGANLTYADAKTRAQSVARARVGLLGNGASLDAIRISDMAFVGEGLLDESVKSFREPGNVTLIRDRPENAYLCSAQDGGKYKRQVWLRGVPDAWIAANVDNGFQDVIPTVLVDRVKALKEALSAAGFALRVLDKEAPRVPLKNVRQQGGYYWIDVDGHGLLADALDVDGVLRKTEVRIKGATGLNVPPVNGVCEVLETTANSFRINRTASVDLVTGYTGGGTFQKRMYKYVACTDLVLQRSASRDTGRAFFVPRGRSRNRK